MIALPTLDAPPLAVPIEPGPRDSVRQRAAGSLRRIGDVMPEVLAQYGLAERLNAQRPESPATPWRGAGDATTLLGADARGARKRPAV